LDAVNLSLWSKSLGKKLQLVLVDRHMDCQRFRENSGILHCGNWVSFCYRSGIISKAVMIGCNDYSKLKAFDSSLRDEGRFLYLPAFDSCDVGSFLDPEEPVYVSVDTDVLDVPSDWGVGKHSLKTVLASPLWEQLRSLSV